MPDDRGAPQDNGQPWRFHDREIARLDKEIETLKLKHSFMEAAQMEIKDELRAEFRSIRGEVKDAIGLLEKRLDEKIDRISNGLTYWSRVIAGVFISGFGLAAVAFVVNGGLRP